MAVKDYFRFEKDFISNTVVPEHVARIVLGKGSIIRLIFTPDGMVAHISKHGDDVLVSQVDDSVEFAAIRKD